MVPLLDGMLMGRSHCCGNACQANLTKYSGATGKIQWQRALFGDGFINSSFFAPNSPADVLSVVASTTSGLLWVTTLDHQSGGDVPRLLLVESATGLIRKVVADCFPAGVAPIFTGATSKPSRRNLAPLSGGRCAVFGREVNSGSAFKVMIVSDNGTVSSSFTPTYSSGRTAYVSLVSLSDDTLIVTNDSGPSVQNRYNTAGSLQWSGSNVVDLLDCRNGVDLSCGVYQGVFVSSGASLTVSPTTGASVSTKTVSGGIQAACVAGTGFALARASVNEILLCDSTLATTATISASVTGGGAVLAGDASRFVAACDRVRYYNTAGTQQWSELVPSNSFTSIALDAAGDVYVGSVRGNVRTEGTTINGF